MWRGMGPLAVPAARLAAGASGAATASKGVRLPSMQMRVRPDHYRAQARRSRELAKRPLNKEIALHLVRVAEAYEKLAQDAERHV